jgi:hypothetical protein
LSSESRRSELNPIRSASVSVRIVGSALHTTHSHHLSKSVCDRPVQLSPIAPKYMRLWWRGQGVKLEGRMNSPSFPPSCPDLERRARSSADAWRSVNGGSYGDSKSLRRPAPPLPPSPMPSVRADPANSRIASKARIGACPISRRGSKIPLVGRVGGTAILTGLPDPRNRLAPSAASAARRPLIAGTSSPRRHGENAEDTRRGRRYRASTGAVR